MKKIIFTLIMVFTLMQTFAQVVKPVVVGGNQKGDDKSTMEVISQNGTKGFMPPRFTSAQMATLKPTLTTANKGLTVFNTDENCLQTWKGTDWSECDAISLAKFTFDCSSATAIKGSYYAGVPVGINNYIEITATVVKAGTYTFYTETADGIRFAYTGIVATIPTGPIKIQIPAVGTPTSVNPAVAFKVYDQSGKEICSSSNFTVPVTENNATFTITCDNTRPIGTFTENQPVDPITNAVSLQLDVDNSGYYSLHTDVIGAAGADTGMWFEGTGYVSTGSAVRIMLNAKGTPKWGSTGALTFTLYDKNNVAVGCTFTVNLQSVKGGFTPDCTVTGTVVNGVFVDGSAPSGANTITVKVDVTKPGPWKIKTDTVKGIYFSNAGTFDKVETGAQIILYAAGTIETGSAGSYPFNLLDVTNNNAVLCTPAAQIVIQANQARMVCNSPYVVANSTLKINTTPTGQVSLPVDFSAVGPYNIVGVGAGVTLRATGTITQIATPTTINFNPVGKPNQANNVDGITFTFTDALGTTCDRNIMITPTKGTTPSYPAKTCKDAMVDNGGAGIAPNGEYWINPTANAANPAIKTLCDMSNGYTMVWSYSEDTAKNIYMPPGKGIPSNYGFNTDTPINSNNINTGAINYANFRVPKLVMQGIQVDNGTLPSITSGANTTNNVWRIKVISTLANASKLDDANALDNYIDITPVSGYAFTTNNSTVNGWHYYTGKLKGKVFTNKPGGGYNPTMGGVAAKGYFYGTPVTSQALYGYPGAPGGASGQSQYINYFGGFSTNYQVSGHFLNCNNNTEVCGPANLEVSPFNRVIQVFLY